MVRKYMDTIVLNNFRPWSKKQLEEKYKINRRNISERLLNKQKKYFKEKITEELMQKAWHPKRMHCWIHYDDCFDDMEN